MEADRYLTALRADVQRLAAAATTDDLGAPVPGCPGLTAGEVVRHLGSVYRRAIGWMREQRPPSDWQREPDPHRDVRAWFMAGFVELAAVLSERPAAHPCATWWPADQTWGFWQRRMAHETAIHRVDVEAAYGPISPIEPAFAADGVDEVLTAFLGWRLRHGPARVPASGATPAGPGGATRPEPPAEPPSASGDDPAGPEQEPARVIGLATGSRLWRILLWPERAEVTPELPYEADAIIRGEPADVYLWLWGRRGIDPLRVDGDAAATTELRDALRRATQ